MGGRLGGQVRGQVGVTGAIARSWRTAEAIVPLRGPGVAAMHATGRSAAGRSAAGRGAVSRGSTRELVWRSLQVQGY